VACLQTYTYEAVTRYFSASQATNDEAAVTSPGRPYSEMTVGVPKEIYPHESRVSVSPAGVAALLKKGFNKVIVAPGAGAAASFPDTEYTKAGADLSSDPYKADVILKVRPPILNSTENETSMINPNSTLISFLYPAQNKELVTELQNKNITSFGMDAIPRISRAQVFDALSSMANTAGYRAVLEASNSFGRFMTGQVTAAGKIPPGKVLVIGGGVAGLSAITTAKRMGAVVRGFDTRPVVKEQVESLGAEFLRVELEEDGSGQGGYAKEMSKVSWSFKVMLVLVLTSRNSSTRKWPFSSPKPRRSISSSPPH
jgi:NAD(P) transhydrogenase